MLDDILNILNSVQPPRPLLAVQGGHWVPIYSLKAFQRLDRPFHRGVCIDLILGVGTD